MEAEAVAVAAYRGDASVIAQAVTSGTDLTREAAVEGAPSSLKEAAAPPLWWAAEAGHLEVVAALLGSGRVDVDKEAAGCTPLARAAGNGSVDVARALVQSGASADAPAARVGDTALGAAAAYGRLECVRLLLEAGADPYRPDPSGRAPLSVATDAAALRELLTHGHAAPAAPPPRGRWRRSGRS